VEEQRYVSIFYHYVIELHFLSASYRNFDNECCLVLSTYLLYVMALFLILSEYLLIQLHVHCFYKLLKYSVYKVTKYLADFAKLGGLGV
jgi:hypothetical protein